MSRVCATDASLQWRGGCVVVMWLVLGQVAPTTSTAKLVVDEEMARPSCTVQFASGSQPCQVFETATDCCSMNFIDENLSTVFHNISVRTSPRSVGHEQEALATISFPHSPRPLDSQLILKMWNYRSSDRQPFCWLVQLLGRGGSRSSYLRAHVDVRLLNGMPPTQWIATTIDANLCSNASVEDAGDRDLSDPLCSSLYMAEPSLQVYGTRQELKLSLTMNESTPLVVRLMSGECEVNCSGVTNDCVVNVTKVTWKNISEPWRHRATVGYHCLRIELPELQSCMIYTHTEMLIDVAKTLPTEMHPHTNAILVLAVLGLLLSLALCTVVCITVRRYKGRLSGGHMLDRVNISSADQQTKGLLLPPEILLLYSRDSIGFCHVVTAFRMLLEKYLQVKVYDPFDDAQMELIARNREGWLTNLLYTPSVRVVFIHSDGARQRENAMGLNKAFAFKQPHFLDVLFTSALSQLQHNATLGHNYQRIFAVRFEDCGSLGMSPALTPYRCFTLLKHFASFVAAIHGYASIDDAELADPKETCCQEVEHLRTTIEDLRRIRREKLACSPQPHTCTQQHHPDKPPA